MAAKTCATAAASAIDSRPEIYDSLYDWPSRLARETPFFRRLFDRVNALRVLDVACGTGHHVNLFHSWGLAVEGADVSREMIAHCRSRWGTSDDERWVVRSFDTPCLDAASFDAVICVGSSLELALDHETVAAAVAAMLSHLRPGGILAIQTTNLWHCPDGVTLWERAKRLRTSDGDRILVKGLRREGTNGVIDGICFKLNGELEGTRFRSKPFLGLEAAELTAMASRAGARRVEVFGDYDGAAYDRRNTINMILVAESTTSVRFGNEHTTSDDSVRPKRSRARRSHCRDRDG